MNETTLLLLDTAKKQHEALEEIAEKLGQNKNVVSFGTEADALRFLRDERTDLILITADGGEDSFACAARLHTVYPDIPIAICLSENTFENAKKAIEAGAFDCLSLPFSEEEVTAVLKRVDELYRLFGGGSLKRYDRSGMSQHMFITRLMQGKVDARMLQEEARRFNVSFEGRSCFVIVVALDAKRSDFRQEEPILRLLPYLENRVSLMVKELSEAYGIGASVYTAGTSYEWLHIILQTDTVMTQEHPFITRVLEGITAMNAELETCMLTAAICQAVQTVDGIFSAHRAADELLHGRHMDKVGTILYEEDNIPPDQNENIVQIPDRELSREIRTGNEEAAVQIIRGVYEQIRTDGHISLESCRYITLNLAVAALRADNSALPESGPDIETLKRIMHMRVLSDMELYITNMAHEIIGKRANGSNRKAYLADEAMDYVHAHYSEQNLTLKKVSNALGISIPYLTVIFRNENHTTFTTYLTETRIERAKELLVSTNRLINSIAKEVGFSSSQYFSATFRKYVGMSPEAYRGKEAKK